MTFARYITLLVKVVLSSSLAIGLFFSIALFLSGGVQGDLSFEIDIAPLDALWFFLGTPVLLTIVFLLITPISFFIHTLLLRVWPGDDV